MVEAKIPYFLFQEVKAVHEFVSKFYAVAVILAFDANHNFCNAITFHRYGKIGTNGSLRAFRFKSPFGAINDTTYQINTKIKRGYKFHKDSIQYAALANYTNFEKFSRNLQGSIFRVGSSAENGLFLLLRDNAENGLFNVFSLDGLKTDKIASVYFRQLSNDNVRFLCSSAAGAFSSDLDLKNRKILEQELKKIENNLLAQPDFGIF